MRSTRVHPSTLSPGTVVSVPVFGLLSHVGIVSDRVGHDGCPMVISNSQRRRGGAEESWSDFTQGKEAKVEPLSSSLPWWEVLDRARSRLGRRWDLLVWNCEHFVRYSLGLEPKSPQLRAVAGAILVVVALRL